MHNPEPSRIHLEIQADKTVKQQAAAVISKLRCVMTYKHMREGWT